MKKNHILNISFSALFCAIICILAQNAIQLHGMPLTLQTFAVALCGYLLGVKRGICSVLAYILLGLIGIPVFSGFKGGIQTLFGISGGFIIGFIFLCLFCAFAQNKQKPILKVVCSALGLILCHVLGVVWLAVVSNTNILSAFLTASAPFILKDAVLIVLAYFIAKTVLKRTDIFK